MTRSILFGILSGALAGLGVGYLIASTKADSDGAREVEARAVTPEAVEPDRDRATERPELADAPRTSSDGVPTPEASAPARLPAAQREPAAEPPDGGGPGRLTPEQLVYVDQQLALGWKSERADEIPAPLVREGRLRVEIMLRDYPAQVGAQLAEEATAAEQFEQALDAANGPQLLALIEDGLISAEQYESVSRLADDRAALRSLYRPPGGGPTVAGAALERWDELEPGATITYGAGVYAVRPDATELSPGVVVQGAGMDATLLVLVTDGWSRKAFDSLELRDVSVFTNHNYLFDQRDPASLTLRNVRVMGFDMGAGGSVALAFSEGLVLDATGCQFLGGYGGWKHGGNLLRGGTVIARFERCLFSDLELGDWDQGSRVLFVDCRLERMLRVGYSDPYELTGSSTLTHHPPPEPGQNLTIESRDLNELFVDWEQRMQR